MSSPQQIHLPQIIICPSLPRSGTLSSSWFQDEDPYQATRPTCLAPADLRSLRDVWIPLPTPHTPLTTLISLQEDHSPVSSPTCSHLQLLPLMSPPWGSHLWPPNSALISLFFSPAGLITASPGGKQLHEGRTLFPSLFPAPMDHNACVASNEESVSNFLK